MLTTGFIFVMLCQILQVSSASRDVKAQDLAAMLKKGQNFGAHEVVVVNSLSLGSSKQNQKFGSARPLCNMFGCRCDPPPGATCCAGYSFDRRANKCRMLV